MLNPVNVVILLIYFLICWSIWSFPLSHSIMTTKAAKENADRTLGYVFGKEEPSLSSSGFMLCGLERCWWSNYSCTALNIFISVFGNMLMYLQNISIHTEGTVIPILGIRKLTWGNNSKCKSVLFLKHGARYAQAVSHGGSSKIFAK
jgi:hypothetical protein